INNGFIFNQVVGSGNIVTKEELFSDFTVDGENGFNVEISNSSTYSIIITADDNIMKFIEVFKSDDTLNVGLK
ncbi:MAG: hypothetical protein P8X91_08280, partial [Candidatus Bathyarchaeota archaeon]